MTDYGSIDGANQETAFNGKPRKFKRIVKLSYHYSEKPRIPSISVGVAYDIENKPISVNTFGAVLPDVNSEVDLNTTSETDVEDRKSYQPNILELALERTICYNPQRRSKPSCLTQVLLCLLTVVSNMAVFIVCPIYVLSVRKAGGDAMVSLLSLVSVLPLPVVLITLILKHAYNKSITLKPAASLPLYAALGAALAFRLTLAFYSSNPTRTPPSLQPALSCSIIIFTVLTSIPIVKKEFSKRRLLCCLIAAAAIFLGIDPRLWTLEDNADQLFTSDSLVEQILWPAVHSASHLPLALYYVTAEKELRKNLIHPYSLSTSGLLSGCVFTVILSGMNFLPGFGYAKDWPDMWENFKNGYKCNFSYAPGCQHSLVKLTVLATSIFCLNAFSVILVSASEGSVMTALISGVSSPLVGIFWSVFYYNYETDVIDWKPKWTNSTTFSIASLTILIPVVILYNFFIIKDLKQAKREETGYSDVSSSDYDWD